MAQFGAKRPVFAPIKTTPDGALPTYDYEKKVTIGKLVKADLTVTNASGELYGDDALAEKVDMFASGSLALETDDKTDEVQTALHGATKDVESGEVTDSDGDVAPRGGLVYYKVIMRKGIRYFKGIFHPETKAILGNDSAATKGSSITFGTWSDALHVSSAVRVPSLFYHRCSILHRCCCLIAYSEILSTSIFFGKTRFRMIDTTNATATTFAENTDCTISGKICHKSISLAAVKPTPTARDNAAMVTFL